MAAIALPCSSRVKTGEASMLAEVGAVGEGGLDRAEVRLDLVERLASLAISKSAVA